LIARPRADAEREQLLEHDADSALADLERESGVLQAAAENAQADLAAAEQLSARNVGDPGRNRKAAGAADRRTGGMERQEGQPGTRPELASALLDSSKSQLADAQARLNAALEGAKDAPDVHGGGT
jgi:hypothetical protein